MPNRRKRTAVYFRLNSDLVQSMRKEFLAYMRGIGKVKDYQSGLTFLEGTKAMRATLRKFANQVKAELENRIRTKSGDPGWAGYYLEESKPLWDLITELGEVPISANTKWDTEEELWEFWQRKHKAWSNRVKRKARPAWKYLTEVGEWAERGGMYGGGQESIELYSPSVEQVRIEGFQIQVRGYDDKDPKDAEVMSNLKEALFLYKRRAQAVFPWMIRNQLPLVAHFPTPGKSGEGPASSAATYNDDHIVLGYWALRSKVDKLVGALAHEMGHHAWNAALSKEGRDFWRSAIYGDYGDLDLREVIAKARPGETLIDLRDRLQSSDPVLYLQLETLLYDTARRRRLRFDTIQDVQGYLDRGGDPMVQVPASPITGYAAKNPEEAFCEALGMLVAYGPQAVLDKILSWLRILLPSLKVASTSRAVRLANLFTRVRVAGRSQMKKLAPEVHDRALLLDVEGDPEAPTVMQLARAMAKGDIKAAKAWLSRISDRLRRPGELPRGLIPAVVGGFSLAGSRRTTAMELARRYLRAL